MNIKIKKLGKIDSANIDISKNLLLFTGYNNTGKTYLNYLLYGLYRMPYGKIKDLIFPIIKIKDNAEDFISIETNLTDFLTKQITEIASIYQKVLSEYCSEIYATNNINPDIEISFSDSDKEIFLETIKEEYTNNQLNIEFEGVKIENSQGKLVAKNGILSLKLPSILKTNQKNYTEVKEHAINILKVNTYLFLERKLQKIAFFNHIYQRDYNKKVYFFPAERSTLNQYTYDIIYSKAEKYSEKTNLYPYETEHNKNISTPEYPVAIDDYIRMVYNLKKQKGKKSDFEYLATELEIILEGKIFVDESGAIKYKMQDNKVLELYQTSSTIKSLAVLILYLRHIAKKEDVIFIDEPEINLHPKNQRIIARLLAKLTNEGVKVIISTHSDYITKELSGLIMLKSDFDEKEELMKEFNFSENELLDKNEIGIYTFTEKGEIEEVKINDYGIEINSFDNEIDKQSQMFDKIYFMKS